mmetsp:Transcript_26199/g.46459  ORF Transcript_26199/g.46459 Transcript_26199/m.46459 type:complete len:114 (-) Transcript_26199:316-657(-)
MPMVQRPTARCHGTPKPRFSSSLGVIRADCDSSEIDRRLEMRLALSATPGSEAGLQLEDGTDIAAQDVPPVRHSAPTSQLMSRELVASASNSSSLCDSSAGGLKEPALRVWRR